MKRAFWMLFLAPFLLALSTGDQAPDFSLKNQDGKWVNLAEMKGKFVLLYFYPKDDTPGCTKEACQFRDQFSHFQKHNTLVYGISRQSEKSHQEFRSKHKLPFDLLVDSDGQLAKAYGVGLIPLLGVHKRESILIGQDTKVIKVYRDVDPSLHSSGVLADIEKALNVKQ